MGPFWFLSVSLGTLFLFFFWLNILRLSTKVNPFSLLTPRGHKMMLAMTDWLTCPCAVHSLCPSWMIPGTPVSVSFCAKVRISALHWASQPVNNSSSKMWLTYFFEVGRASLSQPFGASKVIHSLTSCIEWGSPRVAASWQPFCEGKNGHTNFRHSRIYNFRRFNSVYYAMYHVLVHFLPKKRCFDREKKTLFLSKDFQKVRNSRQIIILWKNSVCWGLKILSSSKLFSEGPSCLCTTSATLGSTGMCGTKSSKSTSN